MGVTTVLFLSGSVQTLAASIQQDDKAEPVNNEKLAGMLASVTGQFISPNQLIDVSKGTTTPEISKKL